MLKNSSLYNPIRRPERVKERRNIVFQQMYRNKLISPEEKDSLSQLPITITYTPESHREGLATYFRAYLQEFMKTWIKENLKEDGTSYNIYRDGLKIYTTLDSRLQLIAEEIVLDAISKSQNKLNNRIINNQEEFELLGHLTIHDKDSVKMMMEGQAELYKDLRSKLLVQTAFSAVNPKTGAIMAMIGGRPDYHDQYNRAVQARRQPGSVFKPFVYTTALENGYTVSQQLLNQPVVLNVQNTDGSWVKWKPQNYGGSTGGLTTLREGLRKSLNLISVRIVQQDYAPAEQVKRTAIRMGISTDIRAVDAIASVSYTHLTLPTKRIV